MRMLFTSDGPTSRVVPTRVMMSSLLQSNSICSLRMVEWHSINGKYTRGCFSRLYLSISCCCVSCKCLEWRRKEAKRSWDFWIEPSEVRSPESDCCVWCVLCVVSCECCCSIPYSVFTTTVIPLPCIPIQIVPSWVMNSSVKEAKRRTVLGALSYKAPSHFIQILHRSKDWDGYAPSDAP